MLIDGKEPSSFTVEPKVDPEWKTLGWWTEQAPAHETSTSRNTAYLVAYLNISGSQIPMRGVRLDGKDGFFRPDRAVIRSLLEGGLLEHEGENFSVTDLGIEKVSPWLAFDGKQFTRASGNNQKG